MKRQSGDMKNLQNIDTGKRKYGLINWKIGMALAAGFILTGCGAARSDLNEYREVTGLEDTLSFAMVSYREVPGTETAEAAETASPLLPEITGAEEEIERRLLTTAEVFSSPSETASRIGSVQSGTRVAVIAYLEESGWGKISYNGRVAYVKADAVENISAVTRADAGSQTGNDGQNGAGANGQAGQTPEGTHADLEGSNQPGQSQAGAGSSPVQGANGNSGSGSSTTSTGRPDSGQNTGASGAGSGNTATPTDRPGGSSPMPTPDGSGSTSAPGTTTPTPDISTPTPPPPVSTPEPDVPTPEPSGSAPESPEPTQDPPEPTVSPSEPTSAPTEEPVPPQPEEPTVLPQPEESSWPEESAGL